MKKLTYRLFAGILPQQKRLRVCLVMLLSLFAFNMVAAPAAYAETRSLKLYYLHTGEKATITFKKNGRYIKSGLKKLNRFLRDWRRNEPTKMDPKLFDLIWEVYKETRSRKYIHVISGFRALKTNNMLRKKGRGVAKTSQHTKGRALDFFIPGVSLSKLRAIGLRKGIGGVGYYPRSGSPFVHMDTGRIRHWPRMTRRQLKKVFPRGRTMHVPTDGKPLPHYQQAVADAKRRKSGKAVYTAGNSTTKKSKDGKSFLAKLFNPGGGSDEEEDNDTTATAPRQVKSVKITNPPKPTKKSNAIDNVIEAEQSNPTQPALASVPLPKTAPRNNAVEPVPQPQDSPAELPDNGSGIGELIAAIPTPRPKNTIDKSIEADEESPVEAPDVTVAALAPATDKPANSITSRIESALLASSEVSADLDAVLHEDDADAKTPEEALPFQKKNINVDAEKTIVASLEPETTPAETAVPSADNIATDNKALDTNAEAVAGSELDEENPLLKDREELGEAETTVVAANVPLPKQRPSDDEIIFSTLVSKHDSKKATAYDVAVTEEKASIPDLKMGDLGIRNTTRLAFQKSSIAEVALMSAPAYGQNMIKLAPSRVLKGGFHNDFDIAPTNRFAAIEISQNLAGVSFD